METARRQAFQNVKDQIGFCGIWCGSCVVGNGALREITARYQAMTKSYGLKEWAPRDFDYDEFAKGLASIRNIPPCPGCRQGGGRDDCEMRTCASTRGLESCTACSDFGTCDHAEILGTMRSKAAAAGLSVRNDDRDRGDLIREWTERAKHSWPCCVLFMDD